MKKILPLAVLITALACTPPQPLATPSGRADVTFAAPKSDVVNSIISMAVDRGYQLKKSENNLIVLGKLDDSMTAAMLFGSRYDSTPEKRITVTIIELDGKCRVMAQFAIVTNPGSAFERITILSKGSKADHEFQAALEQLKVKLEKPQATPSVGTQWM